MFTYSLLWLPAVYYGYLQSTTVVYWLIVTATIAFSKQKGAATQQGQLLYEGGH